MRFLIRPARLSQATLPLLLTAALLPFGWAQNAPQPAPQSTPDQKPTPPGPTLLPPKDNAHINELAHKLLAAAQRVNGLAGDGVKPWHLKIDYLMAAEASAPTQQSSGSSRRRGGGAGPGVGGVVPGQGGGDSAADKVGAGVGAVPVGARNDQTALQQMQHGTAEEWRSEQYRWSRMYTSIHPGWNGSEWRVNRVDRYQVKPKHEEFYRDALQNEVAEPVIHPLWQLAALTADAQLTLNRLEIEGQKLNCVALAGSLSVVQPEWLLPMMCFDTDLRLKIASSGSRTVQYDDFQPFEGRAVARTVRVILNGSLHSQMKVSLLEDFDPSAGENALKPATNAILQPYMLEPGDLKPQPVYETGVVIPLMGNHQPFRGALPVQILVRKDGSVKVLHVLAPGFDLQDITDAVYNAVSRWKYKPYLVDGSPTEIQYTVMYVVDGKPFVPSYERPA
jgi:hypothetical protein